MCSKIELSETDVRRLAAACIVQAVRDYQKGSSKRKAEAAAWLKGPGSVWGASLGLDFELDPSIISYGRRIFAGHRSKRNSGDVQFV